MDAEAFTERLKEALGNKVSSFRISATEHGKMKAKAYRIWADADVSNLKEIVKKLFELQEHPHFSVSSGYDNGREIEMMLHFALNYATPQSLVLFTLRVKLPKSNPVVDTITDLIPGAEISEKEKREFFGIEIKGLATGNVFLDESLAGIHPWRKDAKDLPVKNLHEGESRAR